MNLLFRPKFQQDPRWKRDDYRSCHPEEAAIFLGVCALRSMISEVTAQAVSALGKVQCTPGDKQHGKSKKRSQI
jgi:hypothetical protein